MVKFCLKLGIDVNHPCDYLSCSPFTSSYFERNIDIYKILLKYNANVFYRGPHPAMRVNLDFIPMSWKD